MNFLLFFSSDANTIQAWVALAQLFITIGTVALLVSTFRLQAETFRKQAELTEIEQRRFKYEIRPDMEFLVDWEANKLLFKVINRDLLDAIFSTEEPCDGLEIEYGILGGPDGFQMPTNQQFYLKFNIPPVDNGTLLFDLVVAYSDSIGTRYRVVCTVNKGMRVMKHGPYEIIKKPISRRAFLN